LGRPPRVRVLDLTHIIFDFNRLIMSCKNKCISPEYHQDGELNKGESVCVDRCVSKYLQTNQLVEKVANEVGTRMMGAISGPADAVPAAPQQ
jgi:hypothetical protein